MPSHPVSQPTGHVRSASRAGHSYLDQDRSSPSTSAQPRERPAVPPPFKMRSPSANVVQKSEKREGEKYQHPSQQRTRTMQPVIEIHSTTRGPSNPKEHTTTYRSQPEPGPSNRSQREPTNRSQTEPPASSRSRPETPDLPPSLIAPASMDAEITEPVRRGASYLGTELNPFYRGSFLRVRHSRDSPQSRLSPIHQRGEISEVPRPPTVPGMGLPVKYTRLSQLQAWVFGDPFVKGKTNTGTWSWRQIFGRKKKSPTTKDKPAKTMDAST